MNFQVKRNTLFTFLSLLILLFVISCRKDEIRINDFREKYYGNFYFKIITESWMLCQPTTYDTSYYNGVIRRYELVDSENDMFSDNDSNENPNEKITIEFIKKGKITSLINENGVLIPKAGYHYSHIGEFIHVDTINFNIGGLGGLGGGWAYEVKGIRE